jgi:hypothetical protein
MTSRSTVYTQKSHREYLSTIWRNIKARTTNTNHPHYKNYGGRGIKLSGGWENKENFIKDMYASNLGYQSGFSVERRDIDGDYCPENCTTATRTEQARNTSRTIWVHVNGIKTSICDLADDYGINASTIRRRFRVYNEAQHGEDWFLYLTTEKLSQPPRVPNHGKPVCVEDSWFPSKSEACRVYTKERSTVIGHAKNYNLTFEQAILLTDAQVLKLKRPSGNAAEIVYKDKIYSTHTELANLLGIAQATITKRFHDYKPETHGDWDAYIAAEPINFDKQVCVFGLTFNTVADCARHYGIPSKTVSQWTLTLDQEALETEITNYGKPKKGIRSKIIFQGKEYNQAELARYTGAHQATISAWLKKGKSHQEIEQKLLLLCDP